MKLIISLIVFNIFAFTIEAQTLVGSWQFNGNANDISGNGLNGTVYNATLTTGQAGIPNTAYQFNGINAHIDVPYSTLLNLSTYSIQALVRIDNFNPNTCQAEFIVNRGIQYGTTPWYCMSIGDNTYDHDCNVYSPNYTQFVDGITGPATSGIHAGNYIQSGTWYCHTMVYDGTKLWYYVNGALIDSAALSSNINYASAPPSLLTLVFGYYPSGGTTFPYWLNGAIDNITIWNGVLKPASINLSKHIDTICAGSSVTINTLGTGGFFWSPSTGLNTNTGSVVVASPTTTTTYYISATGVDCSVLTDSVTVVVLPTPATPTITSGSPYCAGSNVSLSTGAVTGGTYTWTGPGGFTSNLQNPIINNAGTTNSGTYSVTVTGSDGCIAPVATANVTVSPVPPAPITNNVTYCQYATTAALTAGAAANGILQWYTTATGGTPSPTITPSSSTPGITTYYVSQIVNGCESARTPLTVTVNAEPAEPAGDSMYIYCQFDTGLSLNITGQTLEWYSTAVGGVGSAATPVLSSSVPDTLNYYVSQTVNGCTSDRKHILIMVKPKPQPPVVSDTNYCKGNAPIILNATGQNLTWYTSAIATSGSAASPVINANTPNGNLAFYVSQTINGCTSNRSVIHVEVNAMPVAAIKASRDTICQYDTVTFYLDTIAVSGYQYSWNLPSGSALAGGNLLSAGPIIVSINGNGDKEISLTVTNGRCVASAVDSILVVPSPTANVVTKNTICVDEVMTIHVDNIVNSNSYSVDLGGGTLLSADTVNNVYNAMWQTPGEYTITVDLNGSFATLCGGFIRDTVFVQPIPEAQIAPLSSTDVCAGDNIVMNVLNPDTSNRYAWYPSQIFFSNGDSEVAIVNNNTEIYLVATSPYGCTASDTVSVYTHPCCGVYFPNAFTPNGDGVNDVFRPITSGTQKLNVFLIENRWGQVVYESRDQYKGWDGKINNTPQDVGTYFYMIRYQCADGKDYMAKGDFELIR